MTSTHAVLAIALEKLGQLDQAHAALARGVQLFQEHWPKFESGNLGDSWHDILIAHLLLLEASALLDPQFVL